MDRSPGIWQSLKRWSRPLRNWLSRNPDNQRRFQLNKQPKIVLLDIETSPIKGLTWGMYDQNVLAVLEPAKIICAAWKYLDDLEIFCKSLPDYRGYRGGIVNDGGLVRERWKVLDEADVVVAHNGDSFDIKRLNARFVAHGLN